MGQTDAVEEAWPVGDGGFGLTHGCLGFSQHIGTQPRRRELVVARDVHVRLLANRPMDRVDVPEHGGSGCTVIAVAELLDQRPVVQFRVPHRLRQHPHAQARELGVDARVAALGHVAGDTAIGVVVEVCRQHIEVRMRHQVVGEVGGVVPHPDRAARSGPLVEHAAEGDVLLLRRRRDGVAEVVLDGRHRDHHVLEWPQRLRQPDAPGIGRRHHELAGELLRYALRRRIRDVQNERRGRALTGDQIGAPELGAMAVGGAILLAEGNEEVLRMRPEALESAIDDRLSDLRVAGARL